MAGQRGNNLHIAEGEWDSGLLQRGKQSNVVQYVGEPQHGRHGKNTAGIQTRFRMPNGTVPGDRVILPVGGIRLTYPTHPIEQAELCCGYNHCAFLTDIQWGGLMLKLRDLFTPSEKAILFPDVVFNGVILEGSSSENVLKSCRCLFLFFLSFFKFCK